ncbi:alpha/beta hydrolase [Nocardia sp. NPDC050630]|uniref:alpha/beta hydrolase n=1 Tax=Nocardia sp. NPDC050630 TaxID=3364321 RepID=UPI0037B67379
MEGLLNPVVQLRELFEGLPNIVRRPIEMVVFGGDLPRADVSRMRWMAAELRDKAEAMKGHSEDAGSLLAQQDSVGALGDRLRETLRLHRDSTVRLHDEAVILADQSEGAANDAEKTLCVMFAFGIELGYRIVRVLAAAAAAGPGGEAAAAPVVESMLAEGRAEVELMRAGLERAYERGAANTAAKLSGSGPVKLAVVVGKAAARPAGVDGGVQLLQAAAGYRNLSPIGDNGENQKGIDLMSILAAGVSGAGGAAGGMVAGRFAPRIFPGVENSRLLLGLVHGAAGAVAGLGAAALITGWPEDFDHILAPMLNGAFAGTVHAHAARSRSAAVEVDGSGLFTRADLRADVPPIKISEEAEHAWETARSTWAAGPDTVAARGAALRTAATGNTETVGSGQSRPSAMPGSMPHDQATGRACGTTDRPTEAGRSDRPADRTSLTAPPRVVASAETAPPPRVLADAAENTAGKHPSGGEHGLVGEDGLAREHGTSEAATGPETPSPPGLAAGSHDDAGSSTPSHRDRADEVSVEFHARSGEHLPEELRLCNLSEEVLKAGLFHPDERESLIAGMEIIRRGTTDEVPGGMVLRGPQLEGGFEMARRPVQMLPGQGKTLMFMSYSMTQAVRHGSVLLVTTADGLAHREFIKYQKVLGGFGFDVLRADHESGFGSVTSGRPAIVVATGETVGHLCNAGHMPPRRVVIDEMDAIVDRGEKTFIRSEIAAGAAGEATVREVFAAHDFLVEALAKGQLSHEDFGLKRIAEEVDVELPDGTFGVGTQYWYDGQAGLTPAGRAKVEALPGGERWLRQVGSSRLEMAAAAEFTCRKNIHYVMDAGKIVIIDQGEHGLQRNPKTSSESRWSAEPGKASLAQAVEAKEIRAAESIGMSAEEHRIVVRADADSAKRITAAEIYGTDRFFDHITGASGTLTDLGEVLKTVYGLEAPHAVDPFNPSRLVQGQPDVHENTRAKLNALAGYAQQMWDGGQGRFQEILCHRNDLVEKQVRALLRAGVPREAIEAVDADRIAKWGADWETELAKVFGAAGEQGKILVINRQGQRGVDIAVSDAVLAKGGMHVWMTEVPEHAYIYEQAKNRTARNGKPGTAQALMSPQDALIRNAMHLRGVREVVVQYEQAVAEHRTDPTPATHDNLVAAGDKLVSLVPGLQQRAHHHATADFILHYAPITDPSALITAMTPWDPGDLVGPDQLVDRSTRLAGLLGIPTSTVTALASTLDQNDALDHNDGDPLVSLLDRANLPPSAVEALRQHLDATAPGKAVQYALLTDGQALDELIPRRNKLAEIIGWAPAKIEGAEGLRHVGAAMTTAQLELARALDLSDSDVTTATARDLLGEALIRQLSDDGTHRPAPSTDPDPADRRAADDSMADDFAARTTVAENSVVENVVAAASLYLATTALLDLVVEIHRRSPNSGVYNGVTAIRLLCEKNADHFTMPPNGIALRGHNWDTVTSSFRHGPPKASKSLDQAVESLKRRPGGVQVLVYKLKNTEAHGSDEADNHLVLLVNDSEPGEPPNLVVVDLAAARDGRTDDDFGPKDLRDRRALLNKAVRFETWQREQQKFIDTVPEAECAFWTIDFDQHGDLVPDSADHDTLPTKTQVPVELVREINEAGESVHVEEPNVLRPAEPVNVGSAPPVDNRRADSTDPDGRVGSRPSDDPGDSQRGSTPHDDPVAHPGPSGSEHQSLRRAGESDAAARTDARTTTVEDDRPGPDGFIGSRPAAELGAVLAEAGITGAVAWPVWRRFAQLHTRPEKAAFVTEVRRDCHARAMDSLSAYSLDPHRPLRHDREGPVEWDSAEADLSGQLAAVAGDLAEVKNLLDSGYADSAYVVIDPTPKGTFAPRDDGRYAHALTFTAVGNVILIRDPRITDDNGRAYPMEWEKWKTAAADRGLYPEPDQRTIYALFFDSASTPIVPSEDDGTRPQHPIAGSPNNEEPQGGTEQPGTEDETGEPSPSGQRRPAAPDSEGQKNTSHDPPDSRATNDSGNEPTEPEESSDTEAPENTNGLDKSDSLLRLAHADPYVGVRLGAELFNDLGSEVMQAMLSLYFMQVLGPGPAGAIGWLSQMPHTVGALIAGHLTDHTPPKKLLIGSQIVSAAGGLTATAALASGSSYSVPILVGTTLVGAGASVVYNSAIDKTLIEMVGKATQGGLSRFSNLKMNLSRVLGQGLGPIALKAGTWTAPLIDVSTSIVNLGTLWRLPASSAAPKTGESDGIRKSIAEGLRAVQNLPLIRRSYANLGLTNFYLGMQGLQFTWLITHSGLPAWQQGPVLLITPFGGVVGSLIPKRWLEKTSIDTLLTARLAGVAGSAIVEALTTNPWVASAGFASTWAVQAVVGVPVTTYMNNTTPSEVRGRVRSIGSATARGTFAASSLFAGGAIALLGHHTTGMSIAATFGTIAGWSLYHRLFKARKLLDCINQTSQATWALGLNTGIKPKRWQRSPEHLRRAIATQLVKIPGTKDPVAKTIDEVQNLKDGADTAVLLLDDGKKMHAITITNTDNKPGGNIVIFDTNITNTDDPHTDANDPDRVPRVRTPEKWNETYPDIKDAFVAFLTADEDDNLTNLHPHDPDQETPRSDGKVLGPLQRAWGRRASPSKNVVSLVDRHSDEQSPDPGAADGRPVYLGTALPVDTGFTDEQQDFGDEALRAGGFADADMLQRPRNRHFADSARRCATENAEWWHSLTDLARPGAVSITQQALIQLYPHQIGNADGIPAAIRDYANRLSISRDLAQFIARKPPERKILNWFRTELTEAERKQFGNLIHTRNHLAQLDRQATEIPGSPPVHVLSYDSTAFNGKGKVVVALGNVDTAQTVNLHVPGTNTTSRSLTYQFKPLRNLYEETLRVDPSLELASIIWIGYDAPTGPISTGYVKAAFRGRARTGGNLLLGDLAAFHATRQFAGTATPDRLSIRLYGHSYGSVTTCYAGRYGRLAGLVASITLSGSPGAGPVHNAAEFGIGADNIFVFASWRDPVTLFGADRPGAWSRYYRRLGLGMDPAAEAFGARRVRAEFLDSPDFIGAEAVHQGYLRHDPVTGLPTETLANAAHITAGRGDTLIAVDRRQPARRLGSMPVDPEHGRYDDGSYHPVARAESSRSILDASLTSAAAESDRTTDTTERGESRDAAQVRKMLAPPPTPRTAPSAGSGGTQRQSASTSGESASHRTPWTATSNSSPGREAHDVPSIAGTVTGSLRTDQKSAPQPTPWTRKDRRPPGGTERAGIETEKVSNPYLFDEWESIGELGRELAEQCVVMGDAAVAAALGTAAPGVAPVIELSVPEALLQRLEAAGMRVAARGPTVLAHGRLRISQGWQGLVMHEALRRRSWMNVQGAGLPDLRGLRVAGLPDVYAWKQERDLPVDVGAAAWIKDFLLSPRCAPLPLTVIATELEEVTKVLHTHLSDDQLADPQIQRAIRLAAEGMYVNRTLYGHPDIGRANQIHGRFELREYRVGAFYHNGFGLIGDLHAVLENGVRQGGDIGEIVLAMVADAWSDILYGGGRRTDNPDAFDEKASAELLFHRAMRHGYGLPTAVLLGMTVEATAFDEATGAQSVELMTSLPDRWLALAGPTVVAQMPRDWPFVALRLANWVAGVDLQTLSEPDALVESIELAVEDLMSRRYSPFRVLGRAMAKMGVRVNFIDKALRLIWDYRNAAPELWDPDMTVGLAFVDRLRRNAGFIDPDTGHRDPDGWILGNRDMRREHAAKIREIADKLEATLLRMERRLAGKPADEPDYTPMDAYREAKQHAVAMAEKYGSFRWQRVMRPEEQPWDLVAVASTLAGWLPEADRPSTSRDAIEAMLRVSELGASVADDGRDAVDQRRTGPGAAIVLTMSEKADGQPRLRAELDYYTRGEPGIDEEYVRAALSGIDCQPRVEESDADTRGRVWHRIKLDFDHPVPDDGQDRSHLVTGRSGPQAMPVGPFADRAAVERRARFLVNGVLKTSEYTDQLAPVVAELLVRSDATVLQLDRDEHDETVAVLDMRAGDWRVQLAVDTNEDAPLPTETTVQLPITPATAEHETAEHPAFETNKRDSAGDRTGASGRVQRLVGTEDPTPHKVAKSESGDSVLVGIVHRTDPDHPQSKAFGGLAHGWLDRTSGHARILLVEGGVPTPGPTERDSLAADSDTGRLAYLAAVHGVEIGSLEENPRDQVAWLIEEKGHDPETVFAYYVLRRIPQALRAQEGYRPDTTEHLLETIAMRSFILPGNVDGRKAFGRVMARLYPERKSPFEFSAADEDWLLRETVDMLAGRPVETPVQRVAADCHERRKAYAVQVVLNAIADGKEVFAIFGEPHFDEMVARMGADFPAGNVRALGDSTETTPRGIHPGTTGVHLPIAPAEDIHENIHAVLTACLPDAPQFVDRLMSAVSELGPGVLTIGVTRPRGHRAVELTVNGTRRSVFFEQDRYQYVPRLSDTDFGNLPVTRQADEALRELLPVNADLTAPATDLAAYVADHLATTEQEGILPHDVLVAAHISQAMYLPGEHRTLQLAVRADTPADMAAGERTIAFVRLPVGTPVVWHPQTGELRTTIDAHITRVVQTVDEQPLRLYAVAGPVGPTGGQHQPTGEGDEPWSPTENESENGQLVPQTDEPSDGEQSANPAQPPGSAAPDTSGPTEPSKSGFLQWIRGRGQPKNKELAPGAHVSGVDAGQPNRAPVEDDAPASPPTPAFSPENDAGAETTTEQAREQTDTNEETDQHSASLSEETSLGELGRKWAGYDERAPRAMQVHLESPHGEFSLDLVCDGDPEVLGRETLVLPTDFPGIDDISARHASIGVHPSGRVWIRDEGSTSHTYVNGTRIKPGSKVILNPGDHVQLGNANKFTVAYPPAEGGPFVNIVDQTRKSKQAMKDLARIPEHIFQRVSDYMNGTPNGGIVIGNRPISQLPGIEETVRNSDGPNHYAKWEHVDGLYLQNDRRVYINSTSRNGSGMLVWHEVGHVVDEVYGAHGDCLSDDESWLDLHRVMVETLRINPKWNRYNNNPQEAFAETFASWVSGSQQLRKFALGDEQITNHLKEYFDRIFR